MAVVAFSIIAVAVVAAAVYVTASVRGLRSCPEAEGEAPAEIAPESQPARALPRPDMVAAVPEGTS